MFTNTESTQDPLAVIAEQDDQIMQEPNQSEHVDLNKDNEKEILKKKLEAADQETLVLSRQLAEKSRQNDLLKNELMDLQANFQQTIRRKDQEKEQAVKFAQEKFFKDFLLILDSVDGALLSMRQSQNEHSDLALGLEMMNRQLEQTLDKFGLAVVSPELGNPFDPSLAEAMSIQPNADYPNNSVLMVIQRGYTLHGRLLRPARVIVSQDLVGETP